MADIQQQQDKKQNRQSWSEYGKEKYNQQYENWMPWVEDFYLRWFTKDNKTSYTAKRMPLFFSTFVTVLSTFALQ